MGHRLSLAVLLRGVLEKVAIVGAKIILEILCYHSNDLCYLIGRYPQSWLECQCAQYFLLKIQAGMTDIDADVDNLHF